MTQTKPTAADIVKDCVVRGGENLRARLVIGVRGQVIWYRNELRDGTFSNRVRYRQLDDLLAWAVSVLPPAPPPEVPHDRP